MAELEALRGEQSLDRIGVVFGFEGADGGGLFEVELPGVQRRAGAALVTALAANFTVSRSIWVVLAILVTEAPRSSIWLRVQRRLVS